MQAEIARNLLTTATEAPVRRRGRGNREVDARMQALVKEYDIPAPRRPGTLMEQTDPRLLQAQGRRGATQGK
jgi:hypothetical protein